MKDWLVKMVILFALIANAGIVFIVKAAIIGTATNWRNLPDFYRGETLIFLGGLGLAALAGIVVAGWIRYLWSLRTVIPIFR